VVVGLKDHPFFKAIDWAGKIEKKIGQWGAGNANRLQFFRALKVAHPFVFDRNVTMEKRMEGRAFENFDTLVEDFSLPFRTSLYLMTDGPSIQCPTHEGSKEFHSVTLLGYLIQELEKDGVADPENFMAYEVCNIEKEGMQVPCINQFRIDLKTMAFALRAAEALDFEIFNAKTEAHVLKETSSVFSFTDCISVKRIGVEVVRKFSMKSKGIDAGVTTLKYDNIIHIADKVEYEYTMPLDDSKVNWDYVGFWRGHWRAFYVKTGDKTRKDENGWNMVDYGRIGKDRTGKYCVPGYTWVVEHPRGNPKLREIKARLVKHA